MSGVWKNTRSIECADKKEDNTQQDTTPLVSLYAYFGKSQFQEYFHKNITALYGL